MPSIQGAYKELNLVENLTANGDYPASSYLTFSGSGCIAIYGTFDTATLTVVFFTEKSDGSFEELPTLTGFTFTSAPAPQLYRFPRNMPFKIRIASAGAGTDLSVNLHNIDD